MIRDRIHAGAVDRGLVGGGRGDPEGSGDTHWGSVRIHGSVAPHVEPVPAQKSHLSHFNRDKIESNLSVPGIQRHQENALIKGFEMSPHLICL